MVFPWRWTTPGYDRHCWSSEQAYQVGLAASAGVLHRPSEIVVSHLVQANKVVDERRWRSCWRATQTKTRHERGFFVQVWRKRNTAAAGFNRPSAEMPDLAIAFGDSGYVALYRHESATDAVYVLAFRHQKEVGY